MKDDNVFNFFYGCSPSDFSETAIITPFLPLKRFEEHGAVVTTFKGQVYSGMILSKSGKEVTIIRCGMGDRFTGDAILLLKKTPVQKIIFVGSCGGLRDCRLGDAVLCESAFNGEGFSRYYAKDFSMKRVLDGGEFIPADSGYTENFRNFFTDRQESECLPKAGDIFTIGSLMAEKREGLLKIEEKGFIGIDLELSAVYNAARVIGLEVVGLLYVSDLPLKKPLGAQLSDQEKKDYNEGLRKVIRCSVEFAIGEEKK
ncbi:MAG: hypothetical protein WBB86_03065 [Candidatus Omnitrophota bacterium]